MVAGGRAVITHAVLQSRLTRRRGAVNYRERLTPLAWRFHKWLSRNWPWVSKIAYLQLLMERDRLMHDLHMMAIECNRLERELRK
jgi:hypothetical protein